MGVTILNCPMNAEQYQGFYQALITAERKALHDFESKIESGVTAGIHKYFEGCLPIEILAQRDSKSLTYGPLRPVGLTDPRTNRWPHAVVQLRRDNLSGSMFNLVGFQTNLRHREQERVFRMIPGLSAADFIRHGEMHRNTFINSPSQMLPTLQSRRRADLFFAGQITGIEGYAGNIASGVLAGINAARMAKGIPLLELPETTMLGALCRYICLADEKHFQPMKANFGLMPELEGSPFRDARERAKGHAARSMAALEETLNSIS